MKAIDGRDVLNEIRDVTDEEIDFYTRNGWVMLRSLFSRDLVSELLGAAKSQAQSEPEGGTAQIGPLARNRVEPFQTVAWGPLMANVAHRLINRRRLTDADVPIRFLKDVVWCRAGGAEGTPYHQDSGMEAADRVGRLNFWVALDEVTPEMGAMRFVTGSHREGPLGWPLPEEYLDQLREDDGRIDPATMGTKARELGEEAIKALHERDVLWQYPKLLDIYEFSPPFHYQPGDATVHQGWMIHGAPPNRTDRDRWCYIIEYSPADVRYRNSRYGDRDLGTPLSDDTAYPVVHPQPALA